MNIEFVGKRPHTEEVAEAAKKGCDELVATRDLALGCDAMSRIFLMAAYVEMVEPS